MGTTFDPLRDWRLLKFYGRMMGTLCRTNTQSDARSFRICKRNNPADPLPLSGSMLPLHEYVTSLLPHNGLVPKQLQQTLKPQRT
eukprot:5762956-Amphidinium_carterae.1